MLRLTLLLILLALPLRAEVPRVSTDIAPVHSLVAQVMQGLGTPGLLMPGASDPHDFQLRPSQARTLSRADLVIWVGPALTPWLDRAMKSLSQGLSLVLLEVPGTHLRTADPGHDHDGVDPHAWLDPDNARTWLDAIAGALAGLDPENAALYHANAATAVARLDLTEQEARALLRPVTDVPLVVFHDAFAYFAQAFGLTIAGTIRDTHAAPPSAAHMAGLRDLVLSGKAACVFAEENAGDGLVLTLIEGTGLRASRLDPTGSRLEPGTNLYGDALINLATTVADCTAK